MEPSQTSHRMPAMMHITSEDLPDIKNWKIGKTYKLVVTVKEVDMHLENNENESSEMMPDEEPTKKGTVEGRFEIVSVKQASSPSYNKKVSQM